MRGRVGATGIVCVVICIFCVIICELWVAVLLVRELVLGVLVLREARVDTAGERGRPGYILSGGCWRSYGHAASHTR